MAAAARELPECIWFEILSRFPLQTLFQSLLYVCKQWLRIITSPLFIRNQFTVGILFDAHFICMEREAVTMHSQPMLRRHRILGSCNGLLLLQVIQCPHLYSVLNPYTKSCVKLPPLPLSSFSFPYGCIAFDPSGKEYKVVLFYGSDLLDMPEGYRTITSSSMEWRSVPRPLPELKWCKDPVMANERVYWKALHHIVCMDLCNEEFSRIELPRGNLSTDLTCLVQMRESLSAFVPNCGKMNSGYYYDVWLLRNQVGRKWERKQRLHASPLSVRTPIGCLRHGEVVILSTLKGNLVAHDVKSGVETEIKSNRECCGSNLTWITHINSLASWNDNT